MHCIDYGKMIGQGVCVWLVIPWFLAPTKGQGAFFIQLFLSEFIVSNLLSKCKHENTKKHWYDFFTNK